MRTIQAFLLGVREFRMSFTTRHDTEALRAAYDWGREWAHRLTLRRFDN